MISTFKKKSSVDYLKLFGDIFIHIETKDYLIAVYPNQFDDFRFFSMVNGIIVKDGGTHIDFLIRCIVDGIKEKLSKKHKTIKYGDIKNKLFIVAILKDVKDLTFTSQSKSAIQNSESQIKAYLSLNIEEFNKMILKSSDIIDPIVEIFQLKELAKQKLELKTLDTKRPKKIKNEKYTPPTRHYKRLYLCEGESAKNGLISGLGREDCGFFEFKGIPLNSYESNIQRVIKNDEFRGLAEILGIKWSETFQICTYDEIIISTDADLDGFHIRGLLLGFIKKYAPNYFTENRVKIFESPYMLIKNKDRIESVIFDANECKATFKGKTIKILKGLGSWNENEFDQMIEKYSLDYFIIPVELDDEGYKYLDDWLISDNINQRKEQIQAYDFDINLV